MHHPQTLCINDDVLRLGSSARINERCLDLQDAKRRTKLRVQTGDELQRSPRHIGPLHWQPGGTPAARARSLTAAGMQRQASQ